MLDALTRAVNDTEKWTLRESPTLAAQLRQSPVVTSTRAGGGAKAGNAPG